MSTTDKYMEVVSADDINPNAIKEPAKAWRNWWKVLRPSRCNDTGIHFEKGDTIPGIRLFPSKDTAEQNAADLMAWNLRENGCHPSEYLGAFPEGERP